MIIGGLLVGGRYTHSYLEQPNPQVLSETAATSSAVSTAGVETVGPSEEVPKRSEVEQHDVAPDHPRYVRINSIDMEARVYSLGVDATNQLLVPESIFDVGWYNGSRLPGQTGAVVMSGYVSGPSTRGVFYYLKALTVGDTIEV
jgi:sortase (surface protein transpeptidase)